MQEELIELINAYRVAITSEAKTDALSAFFKCINPRIYFYFLARISDEDAKDLRNITLLEIHKGIKNFKGNSSKEAWAWCYTIARRCLAKYFEEQEDPITESMDADLLGELNGASSGFDPIKKLDLKLDILEAFAKLKEKHPDCFLILWDYFIVGLDYGELAEKAEKKVDAIRMQVSRCADKLEPFI